MPHDEGLWYDRHGGEPRAESAGGSPRRGIKRIRGAPGEEPRTRNSFLEERLSRVRVAEDDWGLQ